MRMVSLYIHMPFCIKKCHYCDFVSYDDWSAMDSYIDALVQEVSFYSDDNLIIDTIFIGGGTPSLVSQKNLEKIIRAIKENFNCNIEEFTIECNPDSVCEIKLQQFIELGINRLSIGVQSLDDHMLKSIGRIHNSNEALLAIELAEKYFSNINIDLMIGLPYENDERVICSLNKILQHNVSHISLYTLILEKGTQLDKDVKSKNIFLPKEDEVIDRFESMSYILEQNNLMRYEVSNFAKKGFECKHNIGYWRLKEYIGLGVASSGYINRTRYSNVNSIKDYIDCINRRQRPINIEEIITNKESQEEYIMLSLRTSEGIIFDEFKRLYNIDFTLKFQNTINKLTDYIYINDRSLRIKPRYLGILHSIILHFLS